MTIVCRSRQFIFVHLTKCGGTSVEQAFAPHARWNDLIVGSTAWGELLQPVYLKLFGIAKHSPAQEIERRVGSEMWSRYWTVALVRHPMRFCESLYGWVADEVEDYMHKHNLDREQFLARYRSGAVSARFMRWRLIKPFVEATSFAEFVDLAIRQRVFPRSMTARLSRGGSLIVDDVFKLEEIDRFWEAFETKTGLKLQRLHANSSRRREYHWDERHVARIRRRFAADFHNFGYE